MCGKINSRQIDSFAERVSGSILELPGSGAGNPKSSPSIGYRTLINHEVSQFVKKLKFNDDIKVTITNDLKGAVYTKIRYFQIGEV